MGSGILKSKKITKFAKFVIKKLSIMNQETFFGARGHYVCFVKSTMNCHFSALKSFL